MRVKIIKFVPKDVIGSMTDLIPNKILNIDDEPATKLIKNGYATLEL